MNRRSVGLLGLPFAVVLFVLVAGQPAAMEEAQPEKGASQEEPRAHDAFVSCTAWLNCDSQSPNYTGLCCRSCEDPKGQREWYCKKVLQEGAPSEASHAVDIAAGEATLTGIVTAEGILRADDGLRYSVAGDRLTVEELQRNMGKKIEVKGTVQETEGEVTIEVESYRPIYLESAGSRGALKSCKEWLNCDRRPPNYTGTCCRQCDDAQGAKVWDCKVFSEGEHFDMAEWSRRD